MAGLRKNVVGALASALSFIPVESIELLWERIRIKRLCRQLKYCGERVTITIGFYVESPATVTIEDDASFGPNVSIVGIDGCVSGKNSMVTIETLILTTSRNRWPLL